MNGYLELGYRARNGHTYFKRGVSVTEIRRIVNRVKPTTYSVWWFADKESVNPHYDYIVYWNVEGEKSLQSRAGAYVEWGWRYNGVTRIDGTHTEYTNC